MVVTSIKSLIWFQLAWLQAYGVKPYKLDNPETIAQDLEVLKEDIPMFIRWTFLVKERTFANGTSW